MAFIGRGGVYKRPRIFIEEDGNLIADLNSPGISSHSLDVVRDGMMAVVNEPGGTAYNQFRYTGFAEKGVTVYGKTGSTEAPENAWFAGFAEDNKGRSISIAVIIEGGQSGSEDAAPLARDIITFCIEAGYIGRALSTTN